MKTAEQYYKEYSGIEDSDLVSGRCSACNAPDELSISMGRRCPNCQIIFIIAKAIREARRDTLGEVKKNVGDLVVELGERRDDDLDTIDREARQVTKFKDKVIETIEGLEK